MDELAKKILDLLRKAVQTERIRTLGGVTFDLDNREQMLAYRRMKYRMDKAKRALRVAGAEAESKEEEIL